MVREVVCAQSTNRHVLPANGRTRPDGQGGRLCSVNKSSRTSCKRPNEARWSERSSVLSQQIVTYFLQMAERGQMVKEVVCAQSTNRHVLPVNGRTRPDGQRGRLCSVNKSSRTSCKWPNEARWSRRSSVLSQQIVTYFL